MKQKRRNESERKGFHYSSQRFFSSYLSIESFFSMLTGCCYQLNWPCRHHRLNLFLLCWFIFSCFSFWTSLFCLSSFKSPISATKCAENAIFPSFYLSFSSFSNGISSFLSIFMTCEFLGIWIVLCKRLRTGGCYSFLLLVHFKFKLRIFRKMFF